MYVIELLAGDHPFYFPKSQTQLLPTLSLFIFRSLSSVSSWPEGHATGGGSSGEDKLSFPFSFFPSFLNGHEGYILFITSLLFFVFPSLLLS